MALNSFDKLNSYEKQENEPINYEEYFDDEELDEEQKKRRIALANDIERVMLFAFSLITMLTNEENYDYTIVVEELADRYKRVIANYVDIDSYLDEYSLSLARQITQTTIDNLNTVYFLSRERATVISANESDNVLNRDDYIAAIKNGKTKKKWMDVRDKRERKSHIAVGGKVIGITDLFHVGDSVMRFPHDSEYCNDPKELVRCRCRIKYL